MLRITARICKQWRNLSLTHAWNCWYGQHSQIVNLSQLATRVVHWWNGGVLGDAWSSWDKLRVSNRKLAAGQAFKAGKIVTRWAKMWYARAFMQWLEQIAEQRRLRLTSTKAVKRWMHGVPVFAAVWMQWQELHRLRSVADKIVLRWENVKYAGAFAQWVEQTAEQRRLRLTSTKAVKRWMHGVLAAV